MGCGGAHGGGERVGTLCALSMAKSGDRIFFPKVSISQDSKKATETGFLGHQPYLVTDFMALESGGS